MIDILRPSIVVALIVVAMIFLHYATASDTSVDLGPFKDIKKFSRGTAI